jgi:hypothetical protein
MVQKTITLPLGGVDRTLLYGTMGYFSHIKDASGMDPFEWLERFDKQREEGGNNVSVLIEDTVVMIYAGLNSHLDSQDKENVPIDKVKKWCNGLPTETITDIFRCAFGTITDDSVKIEPSQSNGQSEINA